MNPMTAMARESTNSVVEVDERGVVARSLARRLRIAADLPVEDREIGPERFHVERVLLLNSHYVDLGPEH